MPAAPEQNVHEISSDRIVSTGMRDEAVRRPDLLTARLRLLWLKRGLLLRIATWSLAIAAVIAFLLPKQYQSTVRLMPPDDKSSSGMLMMATLASKLGGSGGVAGLAGDVLGLKSSGALFMGVLRSRTVEDDLIRQFNLREIYGEKLWETTRLTLSSRTALSEDRKSGVITITVTDRDPKRVAAMAQAYVTALNSVVSQLTTSSAHRERVFLEQRLVQVKQDLESAEKDFSQFASKSGAIDIKEQGRAVVNGAALLQGQLIAAESELEGLKQIYADNNVRVRALNARIAELHSQLEKLGGKVDGSEAATDPTNSFLYPSIRRLPLLGVPYADLYRRTKVQEAVFETLTQEYELAKVAEAKEIPSVNVLDPAEVPERKSFPPRLQIIVLLTLVSTCCGAVFVIGAAEFRKLDPNNPRKALACEAFEAIDAKMPWSAPNGSRLQSISHKVWTEIVHRNGSPKTPQTE